MPRDGNGNYQLPAGQPVVTNTPISSTVHNAFAQDVATAMTNSLSKDGQTTPTSDLPMGGNKHTSVANAAARNQYGAVGQIQDGSFVAVGTITGNDSLSGSLTPAITGYQIGMTVVLVPAGTNTGAATLALNGQAAKAILKEGGVPVVAGDLVSTAPVSLIYIGTAGWLLLNPQKITGSRISDLPLASMSTLVTDSLLGRVTNSTGVPERIAITDFVQSLLDDADAATARATLGLAGGTAVQIETRNITGRTGTTKTLQSGGSPTGAGDGNMFLIY